MIALGHKNVCRFNVAMNYAFGVRGVERIGNFDGQREQESNIERLRGDAVLERCPVQKLHRDERLRIVLANLVNRADVGMIQCRSGTRLTAEAFQSLGVAGDVLGQELQRHRAAEFGVLGLVHHSHAAATEFARDFVVGKGLPDHRKSNLRPGQRGSQLRRQTLEPS